MLKSAAFEFSVGVGAFVTGLGQISFFCFYINAYSRLHAVWNVVTRFPASGCFKCHYPSHLSSDFVV